MKTVWWCTNFGKKVCEDVLTKGELISHKIATGILHEICLVSGVDIRDLEA